jgi:hypothetical protein
MTGRCGVRLFLGRLLLASAKVVTEHHARAGEIVSRKLGDERAADSSTRTEEESEIRDQIQQHLADGTPLEYNIIKISSRTASLLLGKKENLSAVELLKWQLHEY